MNCVDAGNVLVHLFLQTKTHYVLTNRKLQYLLIIAQMTRLSHEEILFHDDIRNFKHYFVLDAIGNSFMSGADIVSGKSKDAPLDFDVKDFVLPYTKKKIYEISTNLSDDDKELLIRVFLSFGAYNETTLCRLLSEFKSLRECPAFSVIPKSAISSFLISVFDGNALTHNPVLAFIKQQHLNKMTSSQTDDNPSSIVPELKAEHTSPPEVKDPTQETVVDTSNALINTEPPKAVLKGLSSLQNIVAGKQYSVLVELTSPRLDCQVSIVSVTSNEKLSVVRKRLSDTLYRFSFISIASDIKISARIIG